MNDGHHWPSYYATNPVGVPVTDVQQSRLLFKAIKTMVKPRAPRSTPKKKGLISRDQIAIKHSKPKFY